MKGFIDAFLVSLLLFLIIGVANAQDKQQNYYRNFWSPTFHANPLSYCALGEKECGLPVASRFCKLMGYKKADKHMIANNIGLGNYINSNVLCRGWACNGFKLIRCVGNLSSTHPKLYAYRYRRFAFPRMNKYRIDWCYQKKQNCGMRAAHSFCRRMGFLKAKSAQQESGVAATKALGDQSLCFGKQCSGFSEIICFR